MVGIVGASGVQHATPIILSGLPGDFPTPLLVVAAMPDEFTDRFVTYLATKSALPVARAEDGQVPRPGNVYVAGTDPYLLLDAGRLRFHERGPRAYDAKNALFRSMARELGSRAIAVILTGMGTDGAEGMKAVRDAGGHTIAQDEATSLVYGMPRGRRPPRRRLRVAPRREDRPPVT
jgi:two-component system chemotaxis response regulator CheB